MVTFLGGIFQMPRGGKRRGAGRKPGHLNKRTVARQQLAASAAEEGISPLEVMLNRMRHYHSVAERELAKGENADPGIIDRALKAANESAKDAAPFVHARLSAIEHSGSPLDAITEMLKLIDGTSKGLPDLSKIPLDRDLIDVTPTGGAARAPTIDRITSPAATQLTPETAPHHVAKPTATRLPSRQIGSRSLSRRRGARPVL
jgi:hypothetical protein